MSFLLGAAFVAGVLSHQLYFKQGEHHLQALRYLQLSVAVVVLLPLQIGNSAAGSSAISYAPSLFKYGVFGTLLAGLYTSLLVYRLFMHPLNKFDGPMMARVSDLWYSIHIANADAPARLTKLHQKYGKFVRIGSSSLSVAHADGPQAIYGPGSKCYKGSWYEMTWPEVSLHGCRSRALHDKLRRTWSPAFSDKALRGYEQRMKPYIDQLVRQLSCFQGQPVNASEWFNFLSFDVMGDLAFNESFQMLEKGETHWIIKLLQASMDPFHFYFPTWFVRILFHTPGAAKEFHEFSQFSYNAAEKRSKQDPEIPDIMTTLIAPYQKRAPQGVEKDYLTAESRLIIVAGSDTTAATMSYLFCNLCRNPDYIIRLREELAPFTNTDGDVSNTDIQNLPLLNGCINEALRLNPPVPTMVQRMTPPEGITIGDADIPGGMTLWAPQGVIGHDEHIYKNADSFVPERWFSQPDMITNGGKSFAPFSLGPYGCIGKLLALMEVRHAAAKVLTHFDVTFAPGENGESLMHESRDHFTLTLKPMKLVFKPRKS